MSNGAINDVGYIDYSSYRAFTMPDGDINDVGAINDVEYENSAYSAFTMPDRAIPDVVDEVEYNNSLSNPLPKDDDQNDNEK